ncbi:RNA-directed DNA polymerase [Qipengyuania flava]|uniref:reverse transcriptase family protein n=1 Tax=Qipengyuania flava TaxID=192812 RepID=UPI001ADCF53E|nr:reverse transcriptase family protein [Qipengyuania flava]MBO9505160.1 RNA-directed DNA polymerase [Qipengyuania flava]
MKTTKGRLEWLIENKERFTKREDRQIGRKTRNLCYPVGKLRGVHELLKFHFNKIRQPPYLFSPRKGRSQRDNAEHHADKVQFLSLDIKQFYPSTTIEHVFRWAYHEAGLKADVAGMLAHLICIDGKLPFGSPVSPIAATHIHRSMFDAVYDICLENDLQMSLWVDDLTISGAFVRGELIEQIRSVLRRHGFQTHKIKFRQSDKPVIVTGVPVKNRRVIAPRSLHQRVEDGYAELRGAESDNATVSAINQLLSALGTMRYHYGAQSVEGRKAADRMHALRRRRDAIQQASSRQIPSDLSIRKQDEAVTGDGHLPWVAD